MRTPSRTPGRRRAARSSRGRRSRRSPSRFQSVKREQKASSVGQKRIDAEEQDRQREEAPGPDDRLSSIDRSRDTSACRRARRARRRCRRRRCAALTSCRTRRGSPARPRPPASASAPGSCVLQQHAVDHVDHEPGAGRLRRRTRVATRVVEALDERTVDRDRLRFSSVHRGGDARRQLADDLRARASSRRRW